MSYQVRPNLKKLKVFGYPWHVAHQFELAKLFGEYHFLVNPYRTWGTKSRPFPTNAKMVTEFDPAENYDLIIMHVDQQIIDPRISKGNLFRDVREVTKDSGVPVVVINHMVPIYEGYSEEEVIKMMRELVGDIPMIVNSDEARQMWGWGTHLKHGLDPDEWLDLEKEPRAIVVLSPGGMEKAYRRDLLHEVIHLLEEKGITLHWVGVRPKSFSTPEEYRNFLGRSAVFFFPAKDSPFPRARTEAMLSGCCVVTTPYHDADKLIVDGVNGFLVPRNPWQCADLLYELVTSRYKEAIEIGQRGKQTAIEQLHIDRWAEDWEKFLVEIGVIK